MEKKSLFAILVEKKTIFSIWKRKAIFFWKRKAFFLNGKEKPFFLEKKSLFFLKHNFWKRKAFFFLNFFLIFLNIVSYDFLRTNNLYIFQQKKAFPFRKRKALFFWKRKATPIITCITQWNPLKIATIITTVNRVFHLLNNIISASSVRFISLLTFTNDFRNSTIAIKSFH